MTRPRRSVLRPNRLGLHKAMVLVLGVLVFAGATSSHAQTRTVSQSETTVEQTLDDGSLSVTFEIQWHCYGDNRPSQDSRRLIRFFDTAALGFVKVENADGEEELRWVGDRLSDLEEAEDAAVDLFKAQIQNRADPQQYVQVALAELSIDKATLQNFFPTGRRAGDKHLLRIDVREPGERRTVSVSGCYSDAQLRELVAARAAAADRLIAASQGQSQ